MPAIKCDKVAVAKQVQHGITHIALQAHEG